MVREGVCVHSDSSVSGLHIGRFEGRLSDNESIDDNTERPDVNFVRVALLGFQNLRSDIIGSSANGSFTLSIEFKLSGEPKISDLQLHLTGEEEVSKLEISMDNSMRMEILQSCNDLHDVALDFEFMESLSSSNKLVESLV